MRLLFLIQGKSVEDHPGYHDGCLRLLAEGSLSAYEPFCYYGEAEKAGGWKPCWESLIRKAEAFAPDLIFLEFFHGPIRDTQFLMHKLRELPSRPTIASSCGDPFVPGLSFHNFPKSLQDSTGLADLSFFTQMGAGASAAAKWGARNIVFWPHGSCQVRFNSHLNVDNWAPEFDLVFIGSNTIGRNPLSSHNMAAKKRGNIVAALARRYGTRFGLFGNGWSGLKSWQGPIPYLAQVSTMRRGRLVFGGYPHTLADYYLSDRPFIAMGSGIPFLDYCVPKVDRIFRPEEHWYLYRDERDLFAQCDRLLGEDQTDLMARAKTAADLVHEKHTQYHRMKFAAQVMRDLREARQAGRKCPVPHIGFLLADAPQDGAVVNWVG